MVNWGDNMKIFYWITDLLIPLMMIGIGLLFKNNSPKKINWAFGYRTKRSMASQEAWDYANKRFAQIWLKWGMVLVVVITLSKLLIPVSDEILTIIHAIIGIISIFGVIPMVEMELKRRFPS